MNASYITRRGETSRSGCKPVPFTMNLDIDPRRKADTLGTVAQPLLHRKQGLRRCSACSTCLCGVSPPVKIASEHDGPCGNRAQRGSPRWCRFTCFLIGSDKQMEIHKECAFSDASRFSEVRRPDNTPLCTIRPRRDRRTGKRAWGRDRSIGSNHALMAAVRQSARRSATTATEHTRFKVA
jgi:hypothetical protein